MLTHKPKSLRIGQTVVNFLCWLKSEGFVSAKEGCEMADPFYLDDSLMSFYYRKFIREMSKLEVKKKWTVTSLLETLGFGKPKTEEFPNERELFERLEAQRMETLYKFETALKESRDREKQLKKELKELRSKQTV